jgi:hypothetical protein
MHCDVSVILPTYNSSNTLARALDSIYNQSSLPREVIVVDDGSANWERSRKLASSHPASVPVRFFHLDKNCGPSTARNAGVLAAGYRYLAFLDSDDVWFRDKLTVQYELMVRYNLDFSAHGYIADLSRLSSNQEDQTDALPFSRLSSWSFLFRNYNLPTVMVAKNKMPAFDTSLDRNEDWKCWMELFSQRPCRGIYIRRALAGGFKPGIGVSGLSQDVRAMHESRLLALDQLADARTIGQLQYVTGVCVETVKYPVRVLRVRLCNRIARERAAKCRRDGPQSRSVEI